jgi:hypothetical protein
MYEHREMISAYKILVGKPEGKIPLQRCRLRWGDNIKMDLWEIGMEGVDWIYVVQDKETSGSIKGGEFLD